MAEIWEDTAARQKWDASITNSGEAKVPYNGLQLSLGYTKTKGGWIIPSRDFVFCNTTRVSPSVLGLMSMGPILLFQEDASAALRGIAASDVTFPDAASETSTSTSKSTSPSTAIANLSPNQVVGTGLGRWLPFWTVRGRQNSILILEPHRGNRCKVSARLRLGLGLGLSLSLGLRCMGLFLYTVGILFHMECYIRQL